MSIRLRLTLLYCAIITLILATFSLTLYIGQVQSTYNDFVRRLGEGAQAIAEGEALPPSVTDGKQPPPPPDNGQPPPPPDNGQQPPPPPRTEQYYTQLRDSTGQIIKYAPTAGNTPLLPLSDRGLAALNENQTWDEITRIEGIRFLVYSQPVSGSAGQPQIIQVAGSLAGRDNDLAALRNTLAFSSCITLIIAFGLGWLLGRVALRPINQVTGTVRAIGAERDFSRRIAYSGPNDELGRLIATFNQMITELQSAYQQVEQLLQGQRRFVADASHELRTPLTTVRGNLGLLQRQPPISSDDREDVLADTVNETERMMRLIKDMLTLARFDIKSTLLCETLPLKALLEEVRQQINRLAPERTITCQVDRDATIPANRDALKQVLLILGDNTLKHTPPKSAIIFKVTTTDQVPTTDQISTTKAEVVISVSDNGPGINPAHLPHIFDRFYRGDEARTGPGTGLGLAIAKELTEAQHGSLIVENRAGGGTVFKVIFSESPDQS